MAKLGEANIGGRMVPAWLLDLTAEELDSLKWYSERYSNSNLLDNPWFTVNQRGVTSYTSNYSYGVDRWMSRLSGASISNGEIKIGPTNGIAQILEDVLIDYIIGKECTISAIVNGVLHSATRVLSGSYMYFNLGDSGIRMDLNLTATKIVMFFNSSGEDRTISAVKLELGSASTLANDSPPDYTTELLKCMTSKADSADTYANCEIAPKMELGVEYRTVERFIGKPVYVKAISFGAVTIGLNQVSFISDVDRPIRCYAWLTSSRATIPWIGTPGTDQSFCSINGANARIYSTTAFSDGNVIFVGYYYKINE